MRHAAFRFGMCEASSMFLYVKDRNNRTLIKKRDPDLARVSLLLVIYSVQGRKDSRIKFRSPGIWEFHQSRLEDQHL